MNTNRPIICAIWTSLIASLGLIVSVNAATPRFEARYDATDQGPILRHGDGPDGCDLRGMREPSIVQQDGKFYLFYDGCAAPGWLACLATSDDLKTWKKHGRVLSLGPAGSDDAGTASSPWLRKQGDTWYMFHVISAAATPAPDFVPMGPYLAGMATSKSLMGPWTQHRDYVPFGQTAGTPTALGAYPGDIIWYHGEYMMFINGGQAIARTKDLSTPWTIDAKQQLTLPVENSSVYYEPSNGYYWMFLNHIRMYPVPHTDATYVFWTKDPNKWSDRDHAVVLDGRNSKWSKTVTGMATVTKVGNRLAIFYDANDSNDHQHMGRDIGLAWMDLPLSPEKVKLVALPPSEEDDTSSLKEWIWHPTVGEQAAAVRFRGDFELPAGVKAKRARLTITADDAYMLWLNGQRIGSGTDWQQLGIYDVAKHLRAGRNTIAVEVKNNGGAGGMIAGAKVWLENGRVITNGSSSGWRCVTGTDNTLRWTKPEYSAGWPAAKPLGSVSAQPWQLSSSELDLLPAPLAARAAKVVAGTPSLLLGGGFEKGKQNWKVTGGDRIAYDWNRFPRNLWMGDFYFWLNGPGGAAEQISSTAIQAGSSYTLSAQVGYSLDIRKSNLPWPGGRLVLVSKGADGVKTLASVKLPAFTSAEAGRFKKASLTWKASSTSKGRQIGARLESNGAQIAWDNVRLVEQAGSVTRPMNKAKKQSVRPVSKPKVKQTTKPSGLVSTEWVGTDRYGRAMANFAEAGPKRPDKYVGLFYYIWHGQHTPPWGNDVTKYLKEHDGDINGMSYFPVPNAISKDPWGYYWAEPEDGYYHSQDPWILRKHLRLFAAAGVDFLYFDCTNGWTYLNVVEELCKASLELRAQGLKTPQIVFTVASGATAAIQTLYDQFYSKGKYSELWFRWQGKPLILGHKDKAPNEKIASFFTWRKSDAWSGVNEDRWDWINPCGYGWHEKVSQIEQMSVAKGSHATINVGSSYIVNNFSGAFPGGEGYQPPVDKFYLCKDTGKGAYFESQWQNTLSKDPKVVMITQWNEWIAGCFKYEPGGHVDNKFLGRELKSGDRYFVDEFNAEFNRDIEPMKGGYGDVFVYRMLHYIRKFKGMDAPVRASAPMTIPIDGIFTEWSSVQPSYTDFKGDTAHRDFMAYDGGMEIPARFPGDDNIYMKPVDPSVTKHRYTNTTGRNDIIACKVAYDNRNLSMYVKTAANMTPSTGRNWMLLFLDTDNSKATGWEGYDYVINAEVKNQKTTTLKKWVNGDWKLVTSIPFAQRGNQMEIAVPLKSLGINPKAMSFNFHWADNMQNMKHVTEFNSNGDSAPDRGFNFHYSN